MTDRVLFEVADHVATLTLNQPDKLNAFSDDMLRRLVSCIDECEQRDDVRAVILTGAGTRAFCAGGDLKERDGMSDAAWHAQHLVYERMIRAVIDCPVPVIGAVNGAAYGGGCELAMLCDFIIAAETAKFGQPEINLGIVAGMGGTQRLTRFVGKSKSMEMHLTGRFMDAEEAESCGLVSRIVPAKRLMDEAQAAAEKIAEKSALTVMAVKESVNRAYETTLAEGNLHERRLFQMLFATADRTEGMEAFVEKREPDFRDK